MLTITPAQWTLLLRIAKERRRDRYLRIVGYQWQWWPVPKKRNHRFDRPHRATIARLLERGLIHETEHEGGGCVGPTLLLTEAGEAEVARPARDDRRPRHGT